MTKESRDTTESLDTLKRDYQAISAPPFLATRIRAELGSRHSRRPLLRPIFGAAVVAACLLAVVPFVGDEDSAPGAEPRLPSLTALSRAVPSRPDVRSPSFSQLKSVASPKLPARPEIRSTNEPAEFDNTTGQNSFLKETNHELT